MDRGVLRVHTPGQQRAHAGGSGVPDHTLQVAEDAAAELRMAVGPLVAAALRAGYCPRADPLRQQNSSNFLSRCLLVQGVTATLP